MSSVNDLVANQQQLASAMENIYTNFKKDGASRKTPEYIKKRLDMLDMYWFEYESNYSRLSGMELDINTRDFIVRDLDRIKERYENIRGHIQSSEVTAAAAASAAADRPQSPFLKPPTFVPKPLEQEEKTQVNPKQSSSKAALQSTSATVSLTEDMLRKQQSNFKAFHRTIEGIHLEDISERWELEDSLRTVQSRWSAIDTLHWELDSQMYGSNEEYERAFASYERKYQDIKRAISKKMWSVAHLAKSTPQMEIPTFSGNYNCWVSFKDLFNEAIHTNLSMSNAQKMQYLKSKVKGEAERLIASKF